MKRCILGLGQVALCLGLAWPAWAQNAPQSDAVIESMQQAFRRGDAAKLTELLPQAKGHVLEPWAAYWELKARLDKATEEDVQAFLTQWAGTYQEDRLRNDWLLLSGKRQDAGLFAKHLPAFRMQDDRNVLCYALTQANGLAGSDAAQKVKSAWFSKQFSDDTACDAAAKLAYQRKIIDNADVWAKARLAMDAGQVGATRVALDMLGDGLSAQVASISNSPSRYLNTASAKPLDQSVANELAALAIIKMANDNADQAASALIGREKAMPQAMRDWLWAAIARRAALKLQDNAITYARKVNASAQLPTEQQEWLVRVALRAQDWPLVRKRIEQMPANLREQSAWSYWLGRAQLAAGEASAAQSTWRAVANPQGDFYEKLAHEELGQSIPVAAPVSKPSAGAVQQAALNPGLQRALYAIQMGLRSEGVREWNYTVNMHQPGGMNDAERHAAAELACQRQVWDRCINTSERIKGFNDASQRFPMPFQQAVVAQAHSIDLDPAYVYGLIRQESRFIIGARSSVGAQGLMQVMPATARWTAKKIGLDSYRNDQLYELDTNIVLGTNYLKLALDDFQGSMAMAAAAYNAGPGRPRSWRNGPVLDAAIWIENIPFTETRNYAKAVLSNTVDYSALITGKPQSLKARLGTVGPAVEVAASR